jgi:biopolymer transport protein ExbD
MKFPRHARILRGQLDAAPLASVFFLLVMFVLLSSFIYTPGVQIQLPVSDEPQPAIEGPTETVAVDAGGQIYFQNQAINEEDLLARLRSAVARSPEPLTLVVLGDQDMKRKSVDRLGSVARAAGIKKVVLASLPRLFDQPADQSPARF